MSDLIDTACDVEQHYRDAAISVVLSERHTAGPSRTHCAACGEPIDEKRRTVLPGVTLCVTCKEIEEAHNRHMTNRRGSHE